VAIKKKPAAKSPRPSKSYAKFETVAKRSLDLIALQSPVEKIMALAPTTPKLDLSDMTRAAVVLAVAAMDAYFTDVFAERFVPFLKKKGATKTMVKLLEAAGLHTECALELIVMARPYRRIRTLVETYHEHVTTQKHAVIDELFLAYNLKDFSANVEKLKRRRTLLKSLATLVLRRHSIAHEGDLNAHGRVRTIDPANTKTRIQDVITFVSGADELLQRQLPV
jgi:hypothetical protein